MTLRRSVLMGRAFYPLVASSTTPGPNARTLRALGMVEYELKHYVETIGYLRQALASTQRPLTDEQRAQSEQLLTQAGGYVSEYRITLTPKNAALTIDGAPVNVDPARTIFLVAGEHAIDVSAPNHQSTRRTLQVLGGEGAQTLSILLLAERKTTKTLRILRRAINR